MKTMAKVLIGLFIGLFAISGVIALISAVVGMTFGVIGLIFSFVWKILFNPIVLVIIIIVLAYKLNKKSW